MEGPSRVYLFGDQTSDIEAGLRRLLQAKNSTIVQSFFQQCFHAIRQEIAKLPPSHRKLFPRFTSIVDLLSRSRESGPSPVLESALTCIYQLGCFIHFYGDLGHDYPTPSNSHLVGLCTGVLSCTAVSCARNVGELIPAAVESVVIALRLGICVFRVRELVDSADSESTCWSALVSGISEAEASHLIDEYSSKKATPPSSKPYISAVSSNGVTVSAPPTVLDEFVETCISKNYKPVKAPIHGPYHAPHLYDDKDIERILQQSSALEGLTGCSPVIPIISSNTGKPIKAKSIKDLFKVALEEILLRRLCWDKVTESCTSVCKTGTNHSCKLFPISSSATQSLFTVLKKAGVSISLETGVGEIATNPEMRNLTGKAENSKIAIIGMSGRFPDSDGTESFWNLLYKGLDVHRKVPADRWDVDAHVDMTGSKRNTSKVAYGCWINEPGLFDPRFFNMSPREALQADPAQRLALLTAYEALEMAGFIPDSSPSTQRDRVGIFYGMTSDDYREINSGQDIDTYFIPGGNRAFTPGRINYYFKFSGPSVSVDTACSSSLAAIHMACNSIWRNDCDAAITGGVNILTNPDNHAGLDRGHFLSTTGNCNTFDDGADGYCRADGVGSIVLKRLEDAEADNDPILAVINGAYTNHSAEAVSITRPHVGAQAFIFNKLLNDANIDPKDVSYVEMHGTGTQAGDAVEMQSVLDVFAPDYRRGPGQSLHIGSAKANIGHGESASGVTALVKVLLMMRENMIPPHCGIKTKINSNFPTDLAKRNVHIAFQPTPWNRPASGKRRTFVNNFSAAGGNTALLLEDAPIPERQGQDPRSFHLVSVSARSQSALKNNVEALVKYIDSQGKSFGVKETEFLPNLAYTTTARRIHHPFRVTAVGANLQSLRDSLHGALHRETYTPVPSTAPGIGFVFTGQGAQYSGMGKELYRSCFQFRTTIEHFDCIARSQGLPSILPLVDGSVAVEELSPVVVQVGTTCVQMALVNYWTALGVKPAFIIGHSLGDYAALNTAGVLSTSDTIYLCGRRAQLLTKECKIGTHSMLAIKASLAEVKHFLRDELHEVSCVNAPAETVVSGLVADIDELAQKCSTEGLKSTKLKVPYAFHSSQVDPILEAFEDIAQGVTFHKPTTPFVSALFGEVITDVNWECLGPKYLRDHCRKTVNFLGGVEATRHAKLTNDKTLWVEIGSHTICSGMIKATLGPQVTTVASLRREEDTWKVLSNSLASLHLAGIDINWKQYHQDFSSSLQVLRLPSYKWDLKNYWIPYTNNFCLSKGAPVATVAAGPQHEYLTTAAQKVIETRSDGATATVVIENDIADPELNRVIQGHKVNGTALCPSSLYADISQTLAEYLIKKYKPEYDGLGLDVCEVTVPRPLIAKGGQQLFRVSATADWAEKKTTLQIYSVTAEGKKTADHATCTVRFFDCAAAEAEWKRVSYLVKRSIDRLHDIAENGDAHRLGRGMVYKLFAALVDYDDNFKSIREVILDSEQHEATARVKFQAPQGNFHRNPFWIDSFGHLSGFIMNASDATDSKNQVFVNHGWDSMRCLKKFSPDVTYRTYVRMQPWKDSIWAGDVYVFDGDDIVAVYGAVKFQALSRKILDTVLPPVGASKGPARPAASAQKAAPAAASKSRASAPAPAKPAAKPSAPSLVKRALTILAEEVGLSESEITDDLVFADYGVDSLLSLTVTGRYREELDIDLESSIFIDQPTVKDFKQFLAPMSQGEASDGSTSDPESSSSFNGGSSTDESSAGSPVSSPPNEKVTQVEQHATIKEIRAILADEIGVTEEELKDDENLGEMGMDSLLSLTVLGRIRETLDLDLPGEFFIENQTLNDVEDALGLKPKAAPAPAPAPAPVPAPVSAPILKEPVPNANSTIMARASPHPRSTSILLQGNPKTATKTLFLFPDGSGSATSYATIPGVSPDVCVYGLNCPYMKTPEKLKYPLAEMTFPYLAEIRRRQPKGPYNFGGWSAGGICAYDAARYLILEEGEQVDRLLLLDSPFPIGLEKLPTRLYGFINSMGLFGEGNKAPPAWLLPHFLAFIDSLDTYKAVPLPFDDPKWAKKMPKTFMVWAKDGICSKPDDPWPEPDPDGKPDTREMVWLLKNRTDMGPNKWDTLVGPQNVGGITVIEGANHFTMTLGPKAKELGSFIGNAMAN
ncbi:conidial yellow pigment biosynthesis polyketide synthase [Aspergillus awamori]|uniref:Conidial yellow pigment biosynthesis polyketide synthase n=1 Tax=Aspergillus awamori TaxID=105351 RepID=A0A401KJP7_ASPAW|nr:conidial yellow pigment biosynthesis polyketide synthase [Aspergillus awamori]GKZ60483.1 type I Iterative Polyketide synthase (PKS) [Aspergillus niger]